MDRGTSEGDGRTTDDGDQSRNEGFLESHASSGGHSTVWNRIPAGMHERTHVVDPSELA
jgi:hypothetical protein